MGQAALGSWRQAGGIERLHIGCVYAAIFLVVAIMGHGTNDKLFITPSEHVRRLL